MTLDKTKPYGIVYGSATVAFEQEGVLYAADGTAVDAPTVSKPDPIVVETDALEGAKAFLMQVLRGGPRSKAVVYKAAEDNNQLWEDVKRAAGLVSVVKFQFNKSETWKLPEDA